MEIAFGDLVTLEKVQSCKEVQALESIDVESYWEETAIAVYLMHYSLSSKDWLN